MSGLRLKIATPAAAPDGAKGESNLCRFLRWWFIEHLRDAWHSRSPRNRKGYIAQWLMQRGVDLVTVALAGLALHVGAVSLFHTANDRAWSRTSNVLLGVAHGTACFNPLVRLFVSHDAAMDMACEVLKDWGKDGEWSAERVRSAWTLYTMYWKPREKYQDSADTIIRDALRTRPRETLFLSFHYLAALGDCMNEDTQKVLLDTFGDAVAKLPDTVFEETRYGAVNQLCEAFSAVDSQCAPQVAMCQAIFLFRAMEFAGRKLGSGEPRMMDGLLKSLTALPVGPALDIPLLTRTAGMLSLMQFVPVSASAVPGLRPFYLDRTEVTYGEFERFLATGPKLPDPDLFRERGPQVAADPVVWVSVAEARAFADFAHKRLPTVKEWLWACSGKTSVRDWESWVSALADCGNTADRRRSGEAESLLAAAAAAENGLATATLCGMLGNVREWVTDDDHESGAAAMGYDYLSFALDPDTHEAKTALEHFAARYFQANIGFRCAADAALPGEIMKQVDAIREKIKQYLPSGNTP